MSPLEASRDLARHYMEKIAPKKAAEMKKKADELAAIVGLEKKNTPTQMDLLEMFAA